MNAREQFLSNAVKAGIVAMDEAKRSPWRLIGVYSPCVERRLSIKLEQLSRDLDRLIADEVSAANARPSAPSEKGGEA